MSANHALRHARQERGWSQAVVAVHLETSTKNVSRWERGDTRPSPYFRAKLCQLFALDASSLGLLVPELMVPATSAPIIDPWLPRLRLPAEQFLGRQALLDHLRFHLCQGHGHTCVLSGLPGVGKTTIAQVLGMDEVLRTHFSGIIWVSLGFTPDVLGQLRHCAELLGIAQEELARKRNLQEWNPLLRHAIGSRRLFMILDDVWRVEDAQPFLIDTSQVSYLITTRLPQIALALSDGDPVTVPELSQEQSQHLLTLLVPALTRMDAEHVQSVTNFTGGLPLAVTLVGKFLQKEGYGGQTRRLATAIARLLDAPHRLHTNEGSELASDPIQSSLHAAINLSDQHLSTRAQQALRALSILPVKPDYFLEAAALAVCEDSVEVIDTLCDAGLLESIGSGRYTLHQSIADYARMHRTDSAPLQRLIHYGHQLCISQNVEDEYPVVMAALQAAITLSQSQDLLDMLLHLLPFWRTRGYYEQAHSLLSTVLDNNSISGDDTMRARLLAERAQFAVVLEKWELARQCAQAGLELSHLPRIRAQCLQTLGSVALQHGDRVRAKSFYEEGISLARICADRERQSYLLNLLSGLIFQQGDYQQSEYLNREGLDLARQEDNPELICSHLASLGIALQMQANYAESERYLREGLQLTRQLNYQLLQARMLMNLAVTVCEQGDWAQGESLLQEGLLLARRMDDPRTVRRFLMNLGDVATEQEDYDQAEQYIREGLTQEAQTIDVNSRGMLLASLGIVLGKKGAIEEAHAIFEECVSIAHDLGNPWLLSGALRSWGDIYLQTNQLDTAEERFQAALLAYPNGQAQADMIAAAQFGLAKVAALRGRLEDAHELGEQCLRTFTEIHHRTADEVQRWLATLRPATTYELSLHENMVHEEQSAEKLIDNDEVQDQPLCPGCQKHEGVRKRGKNHSGSQRYHCSLCQRDFTLSAYRAPHLLAQAQVSELARQGLSARAIARQVGIHHTTVTRWLKKHYSLTD